MSGDIVWPPGGRNNDDMYCVIEQDDSGHNVEWFCIIEGDEIIHSQIDDRSISSKLSKADVNNHSSRHGECSCPRTRRSERKCKADCKNKYEDSSTSLRRVEHHYPDCIDLSREGFLGCTSDSVKATITCAAADTFRA